MQWMIEKTKVGGGSRALPEEIGNLSAEAKAFIQKAFEDIDPDLAVWDHHCHIADVKGGNPMHKLKYFVFVSAALEHAETATREKRKENRFAAEDLKDFDGKYVRRLAKLVRGIPGPWGKQFLLAMDCWYDLDGRRREDKTGMYTPNDYIIKLAAENPDIFVPAVSVHPYRHDAIQELERCYQAGARLVKWLPNSMGIDPSHEKCFPFYDKMAELKMVLLSHTGKEHTVDGGELRQEYGNPLMLRAPLDRGVQVIAAHCGSRGFATDLDDPGLRTVPSLSLFFRLMDEPKYDGLFFGDISALTSFKRVARALPQILNRTDIHHRLLNGSDYPLPAINVIVWSSKLKKKGLITKEERRILKEVYLYNPLLYDFLVKRTVTSKEGNRFPAAVFMRNPLLKIYDDLPAETLKTYGRLRRVSHERRKSDGDSEKHKKVAGGIMRRSLAAKHRRVSSAGERERELHEADEIHRRLQEEEREKEAEGEKEHEKEKEHEHDHHHHMFSHHLHLPQPHWPHHSHHHHHQERKNKEGRNKAKFSRELSRQSFE